MKAKQIGGGVLVASALVAGWLIVAPPGAVMVVCLPL